MFELEIFEKAKCSLKEKEFLMELINYFVNLSEKAYREGLLSLEDDVENIDNFFLKKGLKLITNGTDPEIVRSILETYIYSSDLKGKELLEKMIILEGVLAIQSGDKPNIIFEKLASYFGEDCHHLLNEKFSENDFIE
jgi:flagellar motor component MotA